MEHLTFFVAFHLNANFWISIILHYLRMHRVTYLFYTELTPEEGKGIFYCLYGNKRFCNVLSGLLLAQS